MLSHLDAFASLYPRSIAPRRLALAVAPAAANGEGGEESRSRVRSYVVDKLERGIPSLFVDVKGLYADAAKMRVVGEVVEEVIADLEKEKSLHADGTSLLFPVSSLQV